MAGVLLVDDHDGVAVVTLNRPHVRNALDRALRQALAATLTELDVDEGVRAIVLTGADPAFCAGLDLKEISTEGLGGGTGMPVHGVTKPVIGAVNGAAVTGGLEIALGCDLLLASERATFADTHARVGVMPGWGLTVRLPEAIGLRRARQMSFTGNYIDASTALAWGLVNEVTRHDRLVDRAIELARDMMSVPAENLAAIKRAYLAAAEPVTGPSLAAEREFATSWSFDRAALAQNREAIQHRGRQSSGSG